jgi:hypothetical protein
LYTSWVLMIQSSRVETSPQANENIKSLLRYDRDWRNWSIQRTDTFSSIPSSFSGSYGKWGERIGWSF